MTHFAGRAGKVLFLSVLTAMLLAATALAADIATGAAALSDGRHYVTQPSALHFLRNPATGPVRASAWVRHRGKSTVLTAVDITGEGGRLLATGEFTFFCVDKALMDQKAAAEQK